jgi:hypothetical protein
MEFVAEPVVTAKDVANRAKVNVTPTFYKNKILPT